MADTARMTRRRASVISCGLAAAYGGTLFALSKLPGGGHWLLPAMAGYALLGAVVVACARARRCDALLILSLAALVPPLLLFARIAGHNYASDGPCSFGMSVVMALFVLLVGLAQIGTMALPLLPRWLAAHARRLLSR